MSNFGSWTAPTGRRLDDPERKNIVGSISLLQSADPERVETARRYLNEIDAETLDRSNRKVWTNAETGERFKPVRSHIDFAIRSDDATAFVVLDGWIVPLIEADTPPKVETKHPGTMVGREGGR